MERTAHRASPKRRTVLVRTVCTISGRGSGASRGILRGLGASPLSSGPASRSGYPRCAGAGRPSSCPYQAPYTAAESIAVARPCAALFPLLLGGAGRPPPPRGCPRTLGGRSPVL